MIDIPTFLSIIPLYEKSFNGSLSPKQAAGVTAIVEFWNLSYSNSNKKWLAYMLATAHHETARTMQPIREYGKGANKPYSKKLKEATYNADDTKLNHKKGEHIPYEDTDEIFYGRGFVQLTWYENYAKAGKKLGIDLLNNADNALDVQNATKIMFWGMEEGWFTGKKLGDYLNDSADDWINARRIILKLDKAELVAKYAENYYNAIDLTEMMQLKLTKKGPSHDSNLTCNYEDKMFAPYGDNNVDSCMLRPTEIEFERFLETIRTFQ